ncbi:MAG: SAM-dependent methyltransferase [Cytophagales bacterium CG12_big_fil_rev_8_21_14_0_65_40_12]|nr:MAG: SAM-dependent methyltransferase [Cytophagales bacterium CG12_big_fil_rev_8_21_14_0_65_40_12]PIW02784.1 MAG: SAM-dependent methyltransferase [Cytophagales bacterium CG17_big_fil_post_rev_8_21_14_2_50_40_13]
MTETIIQKVNQYYSEKITAFGATPRGVDWNSIESQEVRFYQLLKVISTENFDILDYGSGYGALYEFLRRNYSVNFHYTGFDLSPKMIQHAIEIYPANENVSWVSSLKENQTFDFIIASGIFNVKLDIENQAWEEYILDTINQINKLSKKGFAFNMLTNYSDKERRQEKLYYASPEEIFAFCKKNFSKNVALLHDYNLYEFTIIVRK